MDGSLPVVKDLGAPPESWEATDLDSAMRRLVLSPSPVRVSSNSPRNQSGPSDSSASASVTDTDTSLSEDSINSVDQFIRDALQNPRERVSVLRIEKDIEKFVLDPTREQMEFQHLPTSYLRLAAHRVAQHYSLQSMVLLDNSLPDGSGSRIIVRKSSECRVPFIRLADIPVNLPSEDGLVKVAIKQRPQRRSQTFNSPDSQSLKTNSSRSVEERKEEYNKARARIFNSSSFSGSVNGKPTSEKRLQDSIQDNSLGLSKIEEKPVSGGDFDGRIGRVLVESSTSSGRSARSDPEEPVFRPRNSGKVAIFRDREIDRKDPDYDRNYERYMQRFDPGFGFNGGQYTVQPMYAPTLNYNTEFPQLGTPQRPQISTEPQLRPPPQHLLGPWPAVSPSGVGYGPPDTMMPPFNHSHFGAHANSALFLHSNPYPCQHPGLPFIHPYENVRQPFLQVHQQQPNAAFGLARPR